MNNCKYSYQREAKREESNWKSIRDNLTLYFRNNSGLRASKILDHLEEYYTPYKVSTLRDDILGIPFQEIREQDLNLSEMDEILDCLEEIELEANYGQGSEEEEARKIIAKYSL